ncbi:MAG: mechanosensitive ion channel family protein [Chloroflexi bacterium AL-W]|nr:mechanosensitive ion channel family protein [Chloroflexi bacterium AL-N1]NOK71465.1 mechanosensitive ion channel family protein [Chloroflexi bacterium AL-N10]NOK77246.1 mechanosensitive ion channel family protein [Chloroflexi bacterium AL-N5]NOK86286.1 mechanosensitive ion channel family protein [Chloroflexi bacterium AL-W]NOK93256.1 mechanosensitive ion channel family protein [Chloroflexi bacterium AL-N15]
MARSMLSCSYEEHRLFSVDRYLLLLEEKVVAFWEYVLFNNTIQTWGMALLVTIITLIGLRIIQAIIARSVRTVSHRTRFKLDDILVHVVAATKFFVRLILALYAGSQVLTLPREITIWLDTIAIITFLIQIAVWGNAFISAWIQQYRERTFESNAGRYTTMRAMSFIGRLVLFSVILLLALDNIPNVEVTTLLASLGIGGIAVALALQNVLSDLFASLSISLDQPFAIGDFIIIDSFMGTVEHIGLKTTRIRSLTGEQIIFSNTDLISSRIRNYKRMYERRIQFMLTITYDTPYEKLKEIPSIVQEIVESQEKVRFDRAHFKEYADFSLNFEVVYYVLDPDYNFYMDIQQAINLEIYRRFELEKLDFAYPTRTLYVRNGATQEREVGFTANEAFETG